jgi:hypothetical protein
MMACYGDVCPKAARMGQQRNRQSHFSRSPRRVLLRLARQCGESHSPAGKIELFDGISLDAETRDERVASAFTD